MEAPSMVQRSGDTLIIRSVVSGDQLYMGRSANSEKYSSDKINLYEPNLIDGDPNNDSIEEINDNNNSTSTSTKNLNSSDDSNLPQCKIKRNYSCNSCSYFTQNPRHFLAHLRDLHGEKIIINECKHCLYASRHYQKLVRHMKMVHGSTDGLEEQAQSRKRASQLAREEKKRKLQTIASSNSSSSSANNGGGGANSLNNSNVSETIANALPTTPTSMLSKPSASTTPTINAASPILDSPNQMSSEILNQKFLKCTICDYTTLYRTQMVEHEREEHNKTKFFRCQKCSYVTHIKARFSKHVKYHSMPMIKCVMCDFRTPYKWNLDRHMKNHGGAGPFKCSACNFTADIKQSLTVHEMNHHVPPVGHATGMNMTRRRNKVGGTDLTDADYSVINICDNSSGGDVAETNSNDGFDSSSEKRAKFDNDMIEQEFQAIPADLSQKPSTPKKTARPLPNLIPIQPISMIPNESIMNLSVRNASLMAESLLGRDNNELRMKSNQSVLKDFASLFVSEEVFDAASETSQLSPVSNASSAKRKNFFSELIAAGNRNGNLMCVCGHVSKTVSESVIHKKSCGKHSNKHHSISPVNLTINSGGSTRCQFCRHRCKTSADLFVHLQTCVEARNSAAESDDSASEIESHTEKLDVSGDLTDEGFDMINEPHPMENKVFVWNKLPQPSAMNPNHNDNENKSLNEMQRDEHTGQASEDSENNDDEKNDDQSTYYGVETAPGYGEVTKKMNPGDEVMQSSLKKVFKCPHCSFWASTASRFHVHIVGHLNKKPFECSLCSYRSNWRWDITKHIRLKTIRDVSHKNAKVLMNDETGRRNYTKYNKYITLMKVTDEDGDPKLMKSGEMTPGQEAAMSYSKRRDLIDQNYDHDEDRSLSLNQNALLFNISNQNKSMPFNSYGDNANDSEKQSENDSSTKKVSFKCKKCNFRHTNRDVVLQHVKGHYKEANIPSDDQQQQHQAANIPGLSIANANEFNNNVYVNGIVNAAKLLIQQHPQLSQQNDQTIPQIRIQALNQLSGNSSHIFLAEAKQQPPLTIPSITPNTTSPSSILPTSINQNITTTNDNGEMDEASSGINSVNGLRGTAPYRCGHCHQVSNWKHVIQRHCRLKHDGDIQIEIKVKGSDLYQSLALHNSNVAAAAASGSINALTNTNNSTSAPTSTSNQQQDIEPSTSNALTASPEKEVQSLSFITKQYPIKLPLLNEINKKQATTTSEPVLIPEVAIDASRQLDNEQRNLIISLLAKSNILYNGNVLALIKQSEFRCQLCNYEAVNEIMLNQHIQTHLSSASTLINLSGGKNPNDESNTNSNEIQIDLDDAIITNKVPNKAFMHGNEGESDQAPINVKQLQKIQERRQILSNGRQNDKSGTGPTGSDNDAINRDEKCPHCPFTTNKSDVLKEHMMCHICVSGQINLVNCNFCDFSIADESLLSEHSRIHFGLIKNKQKPVAFYTSYDNLEITTIDQQNNNTTNNNNNNNNNDTNSCPTIKTLYPKMNFDLQYNNSSDKENKILVDIDTGHIIK